MAAIFRSRAASPACVMAEAEAMGSADDLESDANCNLCCTPADEFVFLACGHEMCRGCLQKHMTKRSAGRFCPSCFARDVITYEMHWVRGAKPTSAQVRAAALHACRLQPQFAAHSHGRRRLRPSVVAARRAGLRPPRRLVGGLVWTVVMTHTHEA